MAATSSTSSDAESFLLTDLEYDEVKMYKKSGVGASRVERNLLTGGSLSKKSLNLSINCKIHNFYKKLHMMILNVLFREMFIDKIYLILFK